MSNRTVKEILADIAVLEMEFKEVALTEFKAGIAALFAEFGDKLKSIGFTGYTPHFADGDPCTYSVYIDEPYINGFREWDDSDDEDETLFNPFTDANKAEGKPMVKKIVVFLSTFPEHFYQSNFEDGDKVTFYSDGRMDADYHDHD